MERATRHKLNAKIADPSIPKPMTTATTIRMILTALPPEPGGAAADGGYPITCGGIGPPAPAKTGAPHDVQNWVSEDNTAPHFVQKLAILVSLSTHPVMNHSPIT